MQIKQTEVSQLRSGNWRFDVWAPKGRFRVVLVMAKGADESEADAYGRAVWRDAPWYFWEVGKVNAPMPRARID